jgi:hypothetical protein
MSWKELRATYPSKHSYTNIPVVAMATGVVLYEGKGGNSGLDVNGEKNMHTSIMRMK